MTLGQTVQNARKARGLTLTALAIAAGVHKSTLSRWENGKVLPFASELGRVMDVLGFTSEQRRACYQSLEVPRAIQVASADAGAMAVPVSSGELLRALRVRSGLTQADVARQVNVSQGLVTKWERGDCWPDGERLHKFCFAVKATADETVFLATRSWHYHDPLPSNRVALDRIVGYLEMNDSTPHRAGTYLALASRYQMLYREGKIDESEAVDVYGSYGYYLTWRLNRKAQGQQIAASTLQTLRRTRGPLTRGQNDAIMAHVEQWLDTGHIGKVLNLLHGIGDRISWDAKAWWLGMFGMTAARNGNAELASRYYRQSIVEAPDDFDQGVRRQAYIELLCEKGQFREAVTVLAPVPVRETRPCMFITNYLQHAWVLAGLGERREAAVYLTRANQLIQRHQMDDYATQSGAIEHLISGQAHLMVSQ